MTKISQMFIMICLVILLEINCSYSNEDQIIANDISATAAEIDDFVDSLNIDKSKIFAPISPIEPEKIDTSPDDVKTKDRYAIITRTHLNNTNVMSEFDPLKTEMNHVIPGMLLAAGPELRYNDPHMVFFPQAPLNFTVDLPGTGRTFVISPNLAEYHEKMEQIQDNYFRDYSGSEPKLQITSKCEFASSAQQLEFSFGLSVRVYLATVKLKFKETLRSAKMVWICKVTQVFFDVTVKNPGTPSEFFDVKKGVSNIHCEFNLTRPPAYVSSVKYGRIIYMKVTTSLKEREHQASVGLALNAIKYGVGVEAGVKIGNQYKNVSISASIIGGGSDQMNITKARTIDEFFDVVIKTARFAPNNRGAPVSFTYNFIKNNDVAAIRTVVDYAYPTAMFFEPNILIIDLNAKFEAACDLTLTCFRIVKGKLEKKVKSWNNNNAKIKGPKVDQFSLEPLCYVTEGICSIAQFSLFGKGQVEWTKEFTQHFEYNKMLQISLTEEFHITLFKQFYEYGHSFKCDPAPPLPDV